ncbi:hypothetical protein BJ508DRAFT_19874 [Ascobolus immersus RN42]|uniref:Uncharacterized protein n=1 Tax=Ascobolus immersus RN42 TaxID=1160509 RepID=A0A3N4IGZ3_ASCIM|nr:hypothetical protein BJ508DRAFT_19874 [Ascobolus immersus RN42]
MNANPKAPEEPPHETPRTLPSIGRLRPKLSPKSSIFPTDGIMKRPPILRAGVREEDDAPSRQYCTPLEMTEIARLWRLRQGGTLQVLEGWMAEVEDLGSNDIAGRGGEARGAGEEAEVKRESLNFTFLCASVDSGKVEEKNLRLLMAISIAQPTHSIEGQYSHSTKS